MDIRIPDGSQVQIVIGNPAVLALLPGAEAERPARLRRPLLTGVVATVLLLGAFEGGRWTVQHGGVTDSAQAALMGVRPVVGNQRGPAPPGAPEQRAWPEQAPAGLAAAPPAAAPAPGLIPADFARQLEQRPIIIPPPGQPPAGAAPRANPFGLGE